MDVIERKVQTYRMEYGSDLIRVLADHGDQSRVIAICRVSAGSDWSQVVRDARLIVDALNGDHSR